MHERTVNDGVGFWLEQTGPEEFVSHTFTQQLVDAVDIDFDGDTDFLTLGDPATDITLLRNQGDGTFVTETLGVELTDAVYTSYVTDAKGRERIADADGDGDLDIVMTVNPNTGSDQVYLLEQRSSGWVPHILNTTGGSPNYN
ncbi:MAG TPA: hypothetical protein EYQ63_06995, partial [Fuerstia sp.]|nr:hypothetical protein [Fuerstiella sp.]